MSACYISMTRSVSGRATVEEPWEREETGGCGVDSTGCSRGKISRNEKYKKRFYFSPVSECVHMCTFNKKKLSELAINMKCKDIYIYKFCTFTMYHGYTLINEVHINIISRHSDDCLTFQSPDDAQIGSSLRTHIEKEGGSRGEHQTC